MFDVLAYDKSVSAMTILSNDIVERSRAYGALVSGILPFNIQSLHGGDWVPMLYKFCRTAKG